MHRLTPLRWRSFARRLQWSSRPILIGPWRSEVGFELLYWLPFLAHLRETYHLHRDRLITIGRGGSAVWYDTAGTADLYEHLPLETVRTLSLQASQQTGSLKQTTQPAWERHVCALVATQLGLTRYHVLSPSWMYQLCAPWWEGTKPIGWLDRYLRQPITFPKPPLPPELAAKLPAHYVAMRWYVRPTWPLREDLLLWMRRFVEAVAGRVPVVLISRAAHMDDHADINLGSFGALPVLHLSQLHPQTTLDHLAIQSAVIAHAQGYIGTYGGLAQGAMRWGVPTLALYDQFGQTAPQHLALTQHLSLMTGVPFHVTRPATLDTLLPLLIKT